MKAPTRQTAAHRCQLSRSMALFGTDEPVKPARLLVAGPMSAMLQGANLRDIRYDGVELLRGLAFVVRDKGWATLDLTVENFEVEEIASAATVLFRAATRGVEPGIRLKASIRISADGGLEFDVDARATGDFPTNRTGFVILHPILASAGKAVRIEHGDGTLEDSAFPVAVSPGQPFFDIRSMTYQPVAGITMNLRVAGEIFEMEDQRNWTDSTFKTYARPLSKPRPYLLTPHEAVRQSIHVMTSAHRRAPAMPRGAALVELKFGAKNGKVPGFGIACPSGAARLPEAVAARYAKVRFDHLLCGVEPGPDAIGQLATHGEMARRIGHSGEMALESVVSGETPEDDVRTIADAVRAADFIPARISVFMRPYLRAYQPTGEWPRTASFEALYAATRRALPGVSVGGGMYTHFTELNRMRAAAKDVDYVTHTTCPTVHDCDDRSVMQSLEALPFVFQTLREFAPGVPYHVGPIALGLRHNPSGGPVLDNPNRIRLAMTCDDPRWQGLFGASFMIGYAAEAADAGLDAVTFGALAGPFALVSEGHHAGFSAGTMFPAFHALAALAKGSRRPRLDVGFSYPEKVRGVAWVEDDARISILAANCTGETVQICTPPSVDDCPEASVFDMSSVAAGYKDAIVLKSDVIRQTKSIELRPYAFTLIRTAPQQSR